jgi:predicted hydrocarbon binding protein
VDDGELYDNILGGRVFYLSAKTFGEMVGLLGDSISPPAAHALLWNLGHRYGVALGKKAVQATANTEEAVKMLSYAAFRSGWGRNKVTNRLQQDNVVEVVFENCVFCHEQANLQSPTCYFLAGVLGGIAEAVYGKRFESRETKCRAVRGSVCRFLLRPL